MAGKQRNAALIGYLRNCREVVDQGHSWRLTGRLTRVAGLVMEAVGLKLATMAVECCSSILPTAA